MAVNGTLIGSFTALFTGLDLRAMTFPEWQRLLGIAGRNLQRRVAKSFAAQKTAGIVWLSANNPKYTADKIAAGLDPRRGHRTNALQRALETARLFMVTVTAQGNDTAAARITMEEGALHALVPHSVYYEEKKVNTQGILALAASWVREEAVALRRKEMAAQAKRLRIDQNVVRSGIGARRAGALKLIDSLTASQNVLKTGLAARRANALRIIGGIK